jgi:ribosomal protein S11
MKPLQVIIGAGPGRPTLARLLQQASYRLQSIRSTACTPHAIHLYVI